MTLTDYLRCIGLRGTTMRNLGNRGADEIERLRKGERAAIDLLERVLKIANGGQWRDGAGLSIGTHPVFDDVRSLLAEYRKTLLMADYAD